MHTHTAIQTRYSAINELHSSFLYKKRELERLNPHPLIQRQLKNI